MISFMLTLLLLCAVGEIACIVGTIYIVIQIIKEGS